MRVLHFLSNSSIRGGQVVVSSLIRAVRAVNRDTEFGVVLPANGPYVDRFREEGVETFTLPLHRPVLLPSTVRTVIRAFAPTIIHTHERSAGRHVRIAVRDGERPALVHSFHGFWLPEAPGLRHMIIGMENHLSSRTDAFVCVSESEGNEVHSIVSGSRGKIQVIQNSIDPTTTRRQARSPLPPGLQKWFDRNKVLKVISMIARSAPVKNHDLAVAAANVLLRERPGYAFLFVGLPPADVRFRRLQRRFGDRVHAVSGLPTAAPVIKRSWMLFLPSLREGSPLVIQEGFALGIPTIGTRVPGIVDVVQDGWNGILMDLLPGGLSEALARIEQDQGLYEDLCRGAKEQATYIRIGSWGREYLRLYRRLAESGKVNP